MKKFFNVKSDPQDQILNQIKQDENFHDTKDYEKINSMLFNQYFNSEGPRCDRFALTPSELSDNLGNKYIDLRVCAKFFDESDFGDVRVDTTAVMRVDLQGQITFHSREKIEKGVFNEPLSHLKIEKILKAPSTQSEIMAFK